MKRRNHNIHNILKKKRKSAGITQLALAREVGCKQSAISMMEGGNVDAVSEETLKKIADHLGVELDTNTTAPAESLTVNKYCPNHDCPSNIPYVVGNELFFMPTATSAPANKTSRCPYCGEILQSECCNDECGATFTTNRATCQTCGEKYVECFEEIADKTEWADTQRKRIIELKQMINQS